MLNRGTAAGTIAVGIATTVCGLFLLSGVGPPSAGAQIAIPAPATTPSTSDPSISSSISTTDPTTEPTEPSTTVATTTTTTTTTTTSTIATTTTAAVVPSPVPLSVVASNAIVGAGGEVRFDGTCAFGDNGPLGPVIAVVVSGVREVGERIDTGVTAAAWTYRWTAPTDEAAFASFTFQFWCGDPAGFAGGYPAGLERRVDMVASGAATTTTTALIESDPTLTIPETD